MIAAILEFIVSAVIFVFMLGLTLGLVYGLKIVLYLVMGDCEE